MIHDDHRYIKLNHNLRHKLWFTISEGFALRQINQYSQ